MDRIELRDMLYNEFKIFNILFFRSNNKGLVINKNRMNSILNENDELLQFYNIYINMFRSEEEALFCITHLDDYTNHLCPICGKLCKFYIKKKRYQLTCVEKECLLAISRSPEAINKAKQTMLDRYGVEHALQYKEFKDKAKNSTFNRYGVEYASQNKEIKDKVKKTNMERYGSYYLMQADDFKNKSKHTMLKKYNTEYALQSESIREKGKTTRLKKYGNINYNNRNKAKKTCLEIYGCENPLQNITIKNKAKQTMLDRYGVEHALQCDVFQTKFRSTVFKHYGVHYPMQSDIIKEIWRNTFQNNNSFEDIIIEDDIKVVIDNLKEILLLKNISLYKIYNNKDYMIIFIKLLYNLKNRLLKIIEIQKIFGFSFNAIKQRMESLNLLEYFYIKDSKLEMTFKTFLIDHGMIEDKDFKRHDRKSLSSRSLELDFILNDLHLAFEINDMAGHNINVRSIDYHFFKTIKAKEKGIRLIHIWEWELKDPKLWNRVSNWILDLCNTNKTIINIKDCNIQLVPLDQEKLFLNTYDLQGYVKSDICIGLYYNNELVQLMSFKKTNIKNYTWILLRHTIKFNIIIKDSVMLLKNFIDSFKPNYIIGYSALDKFDGEEFESIGFKLSNYIEPHIIYDNKFLSSKSMYNCGYNVYILVNL